jgi:hypothetical protein
MTSEILNADISAGDEFLGAVQLEFQTKDGQICGLKIGRVQLDGDTATAIHQEIIFQSRQEDRAH